MGRTRFATELAPPEFAALESAGVAETRTDAPRRSTAELEEIVGLLASRQDSWLPRVRLRADRR